MKGLFPSLFFLGGLTVYVLGVPTDPTAPVWHGLQLGMYLMGFACGIYWQTWRTQGALKRAALLVLALCLSACAKDATGTNPSAPPSTPAPTLRFVADVLTSTPALAIGQATPAPGAGVSTVTLAIVAADLANVTYLLGEVRWNSAVLRLDAWGEGEWLKQGNAIVDWTHFNNDLGILDLFVSRPTSLPGASGSGEMFRFRLKPAPGITSGSSPIQWSDPVVRTATYSRIPAAVYGGTVIIQ